VFNTHPNLDAKASTSQGNEPLVSLLCSLSYAYCPKDPIHGIVEGAKGEIFVYPESASHQLGTLRRGGTRHRNASTQSEFHRLKPEKREGRSRQVFRKPSRDALCVAGQPRRLHRHGGIPSRLVYLGVYSSRATLRHFCNKDLLSATISLTALSRNFWRYEIGNQELSHGFFLGLTDGTCFAKSG